MAVGRQPDFPRAGKWWKTGGFRQFPGQLPQAIRNQNAAEQGRMAWFSGFPQRLRRRFDLFDFFF
jgi:hypothetical protein